MVEDSPTTALVTGAAGFLGSFLVDGLIGRGFRVVGVDNFFRGKPENLAHLKNNPDFRFLRADLTQVKAVKNLVRLMQEESVSVVFHFAAVNGTRYFYDRPRFVLDENVEAVSGLLSAVAQCPTVRKVVYASSSEVYGDPREIPTPETHPVVLRPEADRDSYAASKVFGEFAVRLFCQERHVSYLIFRIFNCYGERMDTSEYGQVIPEFVRKAFQEPGFTILGDGYQTRSFCYAEDAVTLILEAAGKAGNTILNVGNDEEVTILEVARLVHELTGRPFVPLFLPGRLHDHARRCPDISRLVALTGERPRKSLREGLYQVIEYYRGRLSAARLEAGNYGEKDRPKNRAATNP